MSRPDTMWSWPEASLLLVVVDGMAVLVEVDGFGCSAWNASHSRVTWTRTWLGPSPGVPVLT